MTHIFIGCNQIKGRRSAYFQRLSALEVTETFRSKLTEKMLGRWRTESPKGFAFSMQIHQGVTHGAPENLPEGWDAFAAKDFGLLQDTDAVRAAWAKTLQEAQQLSPKVLYMETPSSMTPSTQNRERLEWFAKELVPMSKVPVVWQPHGLWDLEETVPWARDLGLIPVYDPLDESIEIEPTRGTGYFALYERRGTRATFTDFDMEELLEKLEPFQRAIVIFRGRNAYRDARLAYNVWDALREE